MIHERVQFQFHTTRYIVHSNLWLKWTEKINYFSSMAFSLKANSNKGLQYMGGKSDRKYQAHIIIQAVFYTNSLTTCFDLWCRV